jgi:hypothetical protein
MNGVVDALSNKYVLMGGVAIGVLLLLMNSGGSSGESGPGFNADMFKIQSNNYQAELNTNVQLAGISAGVTKANVAANVQKTQAVLNTMSQLSNARTLEQIRQIESRAGITNNIIASNTAITLDRQQNQTRLMSAQIGATVSMASFKANIAVAQEQGATARYIAKKNANAAIWSSAIGAVAKIAPAAIAAL